MGEPVVRSAADDVAEVDDVEALMCELEVLGQRADALEEMIKARKTRLQAVLNERGLRSAENEYGSCYFSPKRTFEVVPEKVKSLPKKVLLEGFKPSAKLVDACAASGVDLKGAVTIGVYECFSYSPPKGKAAAALRKQAITRSMQEAEEKMAEIMERLAR